MMVSRSGFEESLCYKGGVGRQMIDFFSFLNLHRATAEKDSKKSDQFEESVVSDCQLLATKRRQLLQMG